MAHRFDCLSATLEMPYKDASALPDPKHGWNGPRSESLGASMLEVMLELAPILRAELPPHDGPSPEWARVPPLPPAPSLSAPASHH